MNLRKSVYAALLASALGFAVLPSVSYAQHEGTAHAGDEHPAGVHEFAEQAGGDHEESGHEGAHEHGHEHGPEPINVAEFGHTDSHGRKQPPFIASLINFALLLVILFFAVRRAVNPALADRRAAIESEMGEAQRLRAEAEALHREYAERLENMDSELEKMRGEMQRAGESEYKRIVDEATVRAERMRKDGESAIAQEMKQLRDDLLRQAVMAAHESAEKAIRAQISPADQARLADNYLDNLEKSGGASA